MFLTGIVVLAGMAGLLGVALSALAAHGPGGALLETAARFLLVHAAALLAVAALLPRLLAPRLGRAAAAAMILGLILFCGDLVRRALGGAGLFPMAAPSGGLLLMAGWALLGIAAIVGRRA